MNPALLTQANSESQQLWQSFLYTLQRNKKTGALIRPNEDLSIVKSDFHITPETEAFARKFLETRGMEGVKAHVEAFKNKRKFAQAIEPGLRAAEAEEKKARQASLAVAQRQERADRGDRVAQMEIDKEFQPRVGISTLGLRPSAEIGEEAMSRGMDKIFDFKGFQQDGPAAVLRFLASAPFAALLQNEKTNAWLERTRSDLDKGKFKNKKALEQLFLDTLGAAGNQSLVMADLAGVGSNAVKGIKAVTKGVKTFDDIAGELAKFGASKDVADDIIEAVKKLSPQEIDSLRKGMIQQMQSRGIQIGYGTAGDIAPKAKNEIVPVAQELAKIAPPENPVSSILFGETKKNWLTDIADKIEAKLPSASERGAGSKISKPFVEDVRTILSNSTADTQSDALDLKSAFDRIFNNKQTKKQAYQDIAKKAVNGEAMNPGEKMVWDQWVSINGALIDRARELGVKVNRFVEGSIAEKLIGKPIQFSGNFGELIEGVVLRTGVDEAGRKGIFVDVAGQEVFVRNGRKILTEAIADPETFFPRVLKQKISDAIRRRGSNVRNQAVKHLMDSGQAKSADEAEKLLSAALDPVGEIVSDIRGSRLRMPRSDVVLPESFYEWDFAKVADAHLRDAHLDLAKAKVWGADEAGFLERLKGLPKEDQDRLRAIKAAVFGQQERWPVAEAISHKFRAWNALTKLTVTTAVKQLSQAAPTVMSAGAKNLAKATAEYIKNPQAVTNEVMRLGGGSQSALDFFSMVGALNEDLLSKAADASITFQGIKAMDRLGRIVSAKAHYLNAVDSLENIKKVGRKGEGYRWMTDRVGFSEADIDRIARDGFSREDLIKITRTSEEVQGLTDPLSQPRLFQGPLGKLLFQFQSFNAAMTSNLGWATKEASRGNPKPALRYALASLVAGEVTGDLNAYIGSLLGEDNTRIDELKSSVDKLMAGDYEGLVDLTKRSVENATISGTLGLWDIPKQAWESYGGGGLSAEQRLTAPSVKTSLNVIGAIARTTKTEKDFFTELKEAGVNIGTDEIVLWKKLYKAMNDGKTPRQKYPAGGGGSGINAGLGSGISTGIN